MFSKVKYIYLSVFLVIFIGVSCSPNVISNSVHSEDPPKLDFVFLLHANQAVVPYGDVANDLCYYHVMQVLRNHPNLHFPLHFSGTLLTDLAWFNQSTLDFLRTGIADDQFEMIGSTYAQNIIYSLLDAYDNQIQIEAHQYTLQQILDVSPQGFWNPERCWNQSQYVPLIAEAGYSYSFIEDQILEKTVGSVGSDEFKVRNTSVGDASLLIFNDDKTIIQLVDTVALTLEPSTNPSIITAVDNVIAYLNDLYLQDDNNDYCVVYAQDMEAWGLWQSEKNLNNLANTLDRLDYFLERLEAEASWLNVVTPSEFLTGLSPSYTFDYIPSYEDGAGIWMEPITQVQGYDNWFDFNANDSRLHKFRDQFDVARNRLKAIDSTIQYYKATYDTSAADQLLSYAKFIYAAHQYEFGCIGVYFPWFYRAKSALLAAEAALYSLSPHTGVEVVEQDWDYDENPEYILRDQHYLYIFSSFGGRMINWFDIEKGIVLLGNDLPATYTYQYFQNYPDNTSLSMPIGFVDGTDLWGRTNKIYRLLTKTFMDLIQGSPYPQIWQAAERNAYTNADSIQFSFSFMDCKINKTFQLLSYSDYSELSVVYSIANEGTKVVRPLIDLTFSPNEYQYIFQNRSTVQFSQTSNTQEKTFTFQHLPSSTTITLTTPDVSVVTGSLTAIQPMMGYGLTLSLADVQTSQILGIQFHLGSYSIQTTTSPIPPSNWIQGYSWIIFISLFGVTVISLSICQYLRNYRRLI